MAKGPGGRIGSGWWHNTTVEKRLAQLTAGIELGMTSHQIALASGASARAVTSMASYHGISIPHRASTNATKSARRRSARIAYERGEPVDFWSDDPRIHRVREDDAAEVDFR